MHLRILTTLAFTFVTLLATGCSDGGDDVTTVVEASDYDQSCQVDSDCVTVFSGDRCGCFVCDNSAVNVADAPAYRAALDDAAARCRAGDRSECGSLEPSIAIRAASLDCDWAAFCNAGTCDVFRPDDPDHNLFSRTCTSDADCVVVPGSSANGGICATCGCGEAMSVEGAAMRERLQIAADCDNREGGTCECPDGVCDMCDPPATVCEDGACLQEPGTGCHWVAVAPSTCGG